MQTDSINNIESLLPYAIKKGIVLGIGACILVIVVYIVDYSFLVHWSLSILALVLLLMFVVIFGNQYRRMGSGYLGFGKAFRLAFIILFFSTLIQLMFNILLYSIIDSELPELVTEATITNTEEFLRSIGMSRNQIDEQILRLERVMPGQFTIFAQLKNSWIIILSSAVFALIAGAIIKRNEPIIQNG